MGEAEHYRRPASLPQAAKFHAFGMGGCAFPGLKSILIEAAARPSRKTWRGPLPEAGGQRIMMCGAFARVSPKHEIDLIEPRSSRYGHKVLARSLTGSLRQQPVRVVSPEDFVVLKILATRDRDLEDAVTVVRSLASRIDMDLIERELEALAIEISDHDVMDRWQRAQSRFNSHANPE